MTLFPVKTRAADKSADQSGVVRILIDQDTHNGSFQDGTEKPWSIFSEGGDASLVEPNNESDKKGEYVFHAKVIGGHGRHQVRPWLNLPLAGPEDAKNLVLTCDLEGGEHPIQTFYVEFTFMSGNQYAGVGQPDDSDNPHSNIFTKLQPDEWTHWSSGRIQPPSGWAGGYVQLRLAFIVDNGVEGNLYEAKLTHIRLVQMQDKK